MSLEEKLIVLVQEYPVLYDLGHKDYYNLVMKENIWEEISDQLNEPANVLKKKWNNLRDSYRKSLQKKKTKSGQSAKVVKNWKFEEQMSFLSDHLTMCRQQQSNLSEASVDIIQDEENLQEEQLHLNPAEVISNTEISGDIDTEASTNVTPPANNIAYKKMSHKRMKPIETASSPTALVLQKYLTNKEKNTEKQADDHLTTFFKSAEATVRTFSKFNQVKIKAEISSLLSKYELENLIETEQCNENRYTNLRPVASVEVQPIYSNNSSVSGVSSANSLDNNIMYNTAHASTPVPNYRNNSNLKRPIQQGSPGPSATEQVGQWLTMLQNNHE